MYSNKLISNEVRKIEKEHICTLCEEEIYAGEECNVLRWESQDGGFYDTYLHLRCNNIVERYCIENKHYTYADIVPFKVKFWLKSAYCNDCRESTTCNGHNIFKCEIILRKIHEQGRKFNCYDEAKHDDGKLRPSLVPPQLIWDVAEVREYGVQKYGDAENWKSVEIERYIDAFYRHWLEFINDRYSVDEESRIAHYKHCACNMAFICALMLEREE